MSMQAITISAFRDGRPLTLEELLNALGAAGRSAVWRISNLEVAPGESAKRLHAVSDQGTVLTGDELFALAPGTQVIDGVFEASRVDSREPWVRLRAVDGTSWDVVTEDVRVVRDFERLFPDAIPPA